ncbi:MAG: YfhO family protein, partial [Rudaea sp.]
MILILALALWLAALAATLLPRLAAARRELRLDLGAFGLIGAATLGFFWRLILTGNVWMPAGGGDLAGFIYPTYRFAAEWWRRGVIPLWNPYLFGGQPFIGDIQSGLLYPLNLLTFFLSSPLTFRDLELLSVLHFFIAGAGMYALLRWGGFGAGDMGKRRLSRWACLAGAIAFEFSDLFVTHFGNLNLIASAAWLPLVLLLFMRAADAVGGDVQPVRFSISRVLIPAMLAAIVLAVSLLAGHIQAFVFVLLAPALYALFRGVTRREDAPRMLALFALVLIVALGLSAPVLLPGIEMARASVRSSFSYENAAQFSLPPAELVGLFIPGFFGRGPQAAWGPWARVEVGYLGVFPLILAGLALVLRRDRRAGFFGLIALIGLLLALGGYAILHGWLYALAPGFGQLRAPARFIYLLDFGLAALAAMGLDLLLQPLSDAAQRTLQSLLRAAPWAFLLIALAVGGTVLSMLALGQGQDAVLYQRMASAGNAAAFFILLLALSLALLLARNRVGSSVWAALALALISFDLFSLGAYVDIGLNDPTANYQQPDVVSFLQSDTSLYRIDTRGTGVEGAWLPDTAILYNLSDVNGDNPLVLSSFERYWESIGSRDSAMYERLNIKYVLARQGAPLPANFKRVFVGASGVSVWENTNWLPRARVVYSGAIAADAELLYAALKGPNVNPGKTVLLDKGTAREATPPDNGSAVEIMGYGPNEIDLNAGPGGERYLVLSEVYYPGWRAFVDGRETEVLRADGIFRAISLPAGA